ncbi:aminotransferase class I/II-fold pyridoxal phosphate-dependent enzyme (plasmid) [Streptomyces sp. BB1-1-1]|uniref:DegT/DnrJ/EryC1/StrS family aminotransferase n=1 Tax=Streptomyces sp. BB1-1-1 TaxID=3074430 RepID=UPI002877C4CD|nr:aminotransferase class I/II-fold pyridoxal phosphate-dependent enzyme [Streptomyces sp. BB1-1-1]WND32861.1 aminotransferase class I/II-fold pyridoxal phosphate-dependent enzyme [Streptomyces sp. BB1-1-1]WND40070.1 aminotransferase class I/II-fold pyridoxal phosphate-dependent enzyme [Streptomyces sp. BB1-1-1]WND40905.1 aminotransferase class I/II-fold pyridoxal phosphate-dependent enzyme [Streptomyces sp. BB1-1-1]
MPDRTLLADFGGNPVRTSEWPLWPRLDPDTKAILADVLESGRWAISEDHNGQQLYERQFADAFAQYHGVPHCVPTSSGTASLTIAFEALGLSHGAEVLVPGLTWVACASAAANLGLVPVLVDVDPETLCMDPKAAEAAITNRTEAVLLVHYGSSIADIDAFMSLCERRGLALIEDCAQAHGAMYRDARVGTYGVVSAYSMQESKLLTSGEGGACLTRDANLYERLVEYRADGRRYADDPGVREPNLRDVGTVQGRNLCLTEIGSALLLGGLRRLDAENERRSANAAHLSSLIEKTGYAHSVQARPGVTKRAYYRYCIRLDPGVIEGVSVDRALSTLSRELRLHCEPLHEPLNACRLYDPRRSPHKYDPALLPLLDPTRFELPNAHEARSLFLTIPHRALLGTAADMDDIAQAIDKVMTNVDALRSEALMVP